MTRATLRDVAAQAGVSHQTVSNVLNGHPSIRPTTRQRVLDAIQRLDYHPNQAAKALRESRSTTLCCVFYDMSPGDIADPYRNLIQSAFINEANAQGYSLITLFLNSQRPETFEQMRSAFLQGRFGGALVVGAAPDAQQLQVFEDWQMPTVLFDQMVPCLDLPSVSADYAGGMQQLVTHHAAQGKKRLALIIPTSYQGSTALARRDGFVRAAEELGLAYTVVEGDWSYAAGEAAFEALWHSDFRPDAVLAGNDRMAAGALRAAWRLNLRVPQDVAISGFDDFEFALYTVPTLTTMHVPYAEMARQSVSLLISQINGEAREPRSLVLAPELTVRESA